jgi:hypothetical protein
MDSIDNRHCTREKVYRRCPALKMKNEEKNETSGTEGVPSAPDGDDTLLVLIG